MSQTVLKDVFNLVVILGITVLAAIMLQLISYVLSKDQLPWAAVGLGAQASKGWDSAAVISSADQGNCHEKRLREIYHIAFLLRQVIDADLVPIILEHAHLFESRTCSIHLGNGLKVSQTHSPFELLVSGPIESNVRVQRPVRTVIFEIESHDQGFASVRDGGSWTWFTATIHRQSRIGDTTSNDVAVEREIYSNPIADDFWRTHVVKWHSNATDKSEAEWVSSLRVGDKISVSAQARFPAWVNYVRSAKITVRTIALAG